MQIVSNVKTCFLVKIRKKKTHFLKSRAEFFTQSAKR